MVVSSCYIAQNDRNQQNFPEINITSQYYMQNIANLHKKSSEVQNEQNCFCHFWFCAICRSTKSCLILKFIPPKTISNILLSFEDISVLISQKLRKLQQNNISRFFPRTVRNYLSQRIISGSSFCISPSLGLWLKKVFKEKSLVRIRD